MTESQTVHIHAPLPLAAAVLTERCPVCEKRTRHLVSMYAWYGDSHKCLNCGDEWRDGELMSRPFARGWRERSIANGKGYVRRLRELGRLVTTKSAMMRMLRASMPDSV